MKNSMKEDMRMKEKAAKVSKFGKEVERHEMKEIKAEKGMHHKNMASHHKEMAKHHESIAKHHHGMAKTHEGMKGAKKR